MPYRTTPAEPTFQSLREPALRPDPGERPFPTALDPFTCNRYEIGDFATATRWRSASAISACAAAPARTTSAASLKRSAALHRPAAISADMSRHAYFGTDDRLKAANRKFATEL